MTRAWLPTETNLVDYAKQTTAAITGPMKIGPLVSYMPMDGGPRRHRFPAKLVRYLPADRGQARQGPHDGRGGWLVTWSIHYRDEKTGYPVRVDNEVNKNITFHMNLAHKGPLPVPRCANNDGALCATPYEPDTAHQPSTVYLPYLVTGDYYYLEELQFWAAWNPLGTDRAIPVTDKAWCAGSNCVAKHGRCGRWAMWPISRLTTTI